MVCVTIMNLRKHYMCYSDVLRFTKHVPVRCLLKKKKRRLSCVCSFIILFLYPKIFKKLAPHVILCVIIIVKKIFRNVCILYVQSE